MKKLLITMNLLLVILFHNPVYANEGNFRFQDIFKNQGSIMLLIEVETGQIKDTNIAAANFYGYTIEELLGMTIQEINTLSSEEVKFEREIAAAQERNYFIFKHKLKDGTIRDVEVYSFPYTNENGEELLFSTIYDITPRIEAQNEASRSKLVIIILLVLGLIVLGIIIFFIYSSKQKIKISNNRLKSLFDNMQEGFALHEIICDTKGKPVDYKFIEVNKSFENMTGLKGDKIKNRTVKEMLPNTESYWIDIYGKVALTGIHTSFTNFSKEIGKYFSVSVYSPEKKQFATIITDITEQIKLEKDLRAERALFQTTLHSLGDGVISTDKNGKVDLMNAVAEELTGWSNSEAKGVEFDQVFHIINDITREKYVDPVREVFETGETIELGNHTLLIMKNGEELAIEDSIAPIKDEKGNINGVVIVFRDFTERKNEQDRIIYLSYHDQLTGLYNRRFFEEELKRLNTDRNLPLTIAMIDVNGLKLTNDAFGHLVGDELLRRVSEVIKRECRSDDIIARIGGDEFIILLPRTTYVETENIVNRIYKGMAEETLDSIIISVSIGWDTKLSSDQLISDTFIKAEENMYSKKIYESQTMRNQTIQVILTTLYMRNERESIHSERVSLISRLIGEALNLDNDSLKDIEISGLMHDIGKIAINEYLLVKPGELTQAEYEEIKRHPESSYQILKSVNSFSPLAEYVLSHHERWDGSGYPRGIQGEEIPLISRIITVADAYEAMTSDRIFKKARDKKDAVNELIKHSGTQFDPSIVKVFIDNIDNWIIDKRF